MGLNSEDPIRYIQHLLENKSSAKQKAYKNICWAFSVLSSEAMRIVRELQGRTRPSDDDVTVEYTAINAHEFDVKLAGDMLIFILNTNVVTLEETHPVLSDPYMAENDVNRYFGQIMVYNFMAESLKFNRYNDPGYLLARVMINHECRFFIEGDRDLQIYNSISDEKVAEGILQQFVKVVLKMAIENDLIAPPFVEVKSTTLNQKNDHLLELGGARKIGFRMSYENNTEG